MYFKIECGWIWGRVFEYYFGWFWFDKIFEVVCIFVLSGCDDDDVWNWGFCEDVVGCFGV